MAKILIIGGGVAGLSAGIYARLHGHEAILCERGKTAGGNLTSWRRGEYEIDNCIHWLTGTNPASDTYRMWKELGALEKTPVFQGEALYTSERGGERLALSRDLDLLERDLFELSPNDGREIRRLVRTVRALQGMAGIGGAGHNEKKRPTPADLAALRRYWSMTTGELAARFSHPLIRAFLTDLLSEDFGSLAFLLVAAHYCGENGGIPAGSSRGMANRMERRFCDLGGDLLFEKEAVRINRTGNRATSVRFADRDEIDADFIVTTAEPTQVFFRLLHEDLPGFFLRRYQSPRWLRFSSCHCAFSCDSADLPFRGDLILPRPDGKRTVIREFTHEKSFAPEGKTVLQTMTVCGEKEAKELIALKRSPASYLEKKRALARDAARLVTGRFPELAGKIRLIDCWTPATYRRYVASEIGSFMSFVFPSRTLPRWAKNRVRSAENVILAGQWLLSPGGLPIAAESGRRAVETIDRLCRA